MSPMSPLAQVDASFIPTGYTPAMQAPVTTRSNGVRGPAGSTTSSSAFAAAPTKADSAMKRLGSTRSASPSNALATQPITNPACTPLVRAACANPVSPYCATSAGTTADAENHSAIAATWQSAMIAIDASFDWKNPVIARPPNPHPPREPRGRAP